MTQDELIAAQDGQRTQRQFISLLGGVFGLDQSLASQDGYAVNQPGQYQTVTPFGVAVEGRPISNQQSVTFTLPLLLLAGLAAFLILK